MKEKLYIVVHTQGDYYNQFLVKANNKSEAIDILYSQYVLMGYSGKNTEDGYRPIPKCELKAFDLEKEFKINSSQNGKLLNIDYA